MQACIIGHKRSHSHENQHLINNKMTDFINGRCDPPRKGEQKGIKEATLETCETFCSSCEAEHQKRSQASEGSITDKFTPCEKCKQLRNNTCSVERQSTWLSTFQVRNESEVPRNCSLIDKDVKEYCINTVTDKLLSTVNMKELEDGRRWNKGGIFFHTLT